MKSKLFLSVLTFIFSSSALAYDPKLSHLYWNRIGSSSSLVFFDNSPNVKKNASNDKYLIIDHNFETKCKVAFLDPKDNFVLPRKEFNKLPKDDDYRYLKKENFVKIRVIRCPSHRSLEGKTLFLPRYRSIGTSRNFDPFLVDSASYQKRVDTLLDILESQHDIDGLEQIYDDFKGTDNALKAKKKIDHIVQLTQKRIQNQKREKELASKAVNEEFHDSLTSRENLINFARKIAKDKVYKKSEYGNNSLRYSQFITKNNMAKAMYEKASKDDEINLYQDTASLFPQSPFAKKAIESIYNLSKNENNIAGYSWFIKNYPSAKQAKQALTNMHKLAFELAEDINTINAYNDFVIAYPTAKQVNEANERAYELEKSEYVGMLSYFSEEKDARRLLVQSKMLEQSAEDLPRDERVGYMMVVNRMNDLLKQEFNSTDAALRHLESNEFKSFVRTFKRSMKDLKYQVNRIADNTADLSSIMKQQSSMLNNHFENAAQDREMASELTKQHRHWERFIGEVGL